VQAACLPAPNFQPAGTQEPDGPCGNQHYIRELPMMGTEVPKYVEHIIVIIKQELPYSWFLFFSYHNDARSNTH